MVAVARDVTKHMSPDEHGDPEGGYCPMSLPNPETASVIAEYSALIGRCLFAFADLEGIVLTVLRRLSELPDPIARAFVGTPKIMEASERIVRVAAAQEFSDDDINRLLKWKKLIRYVAEVRNVLAHQVPTWRVGWLRYDNYMTSTNIWDLKRRMYVVRIDELDAFIKLIELVQRVPYPVDASKQRHPDSILRMQDELFNYWQITNLPPYVGA